MDKDFSHWHRMTIDDTAVYIFPQGPDWILPSLKGDELICRGGRVPEGCDPKTRRFFDELALPGTRQAYEGRRAHLSLDGLKECWFHITHACNLSCRHCMFSCSPADTAAMGLATFESLFHQAFDLGARTFFVTGGEPLVHPDFKEICTLVLEKSLDTRLVILTNGLLVESFLPFFTSLPGDRLHFQVSLDGNQGSHDHIRGRGTFERLAENLELLARINGNICLAMAVTPDNVDQMPDMVDIAAQYGISNIHYLWMFAHGKADKESLVPVDRLFARLREADRLAVEKDIAIDNIQAIEKQVFSPQGTRHDLGSAGWESLAIGPDGRVYPTPALIRESEAVCGHAGQGLETVWRQSELLDHIRGLTLVESSREHDPLKFIVGGGDLDHSFYHGRAFMGHDPYIDLYRRLALWLMARGAGNKGPAHIGWPCVLVRMGDRLLTCDDAHGEVALTHSNCVLSISTRNAGVQTFYGNAADAPNLDIANPVCYPEEEISHVPQEARVRSYGCGSPVLDAGIRPGQTLVDLGSGAGMECFVAARKVGKTGRVFGIDMTDPMLAMARKSLEKVEMALSYQNIEFKKSFLEDLPLDNDSVDIVISNCVINLSGDKHQTFREIHRILKPGGRLVISDIVTDTVPDPVILNDPRLRGECIAGALTTPRLLSLLEIAGFENTCILKRFFYREVRGHAFFSITYEAHKPIALADQKKKQVLYPGPFAAVITDEGRMLVRGRQEQIHWPGTAGADLFVLDDQGNVANMDMENSCSCTTPPEARDQVAEKVVKKMSSGCMTCGKPLQYFTQNRVMACRICGREKPANAMCEDGHFVCDACHSKDAFDIVRDLCLGSRETDMIKLFNRIRRHPAVPLHGPEHHFAVPGAITAAYRNLGGAISDDQILSALERGKAIPGGVCAFWGGCGAALGVGIAFGIILESTPVKAGPRQTIQQVTGKIIERLGEIAAARCCQRESWTAMIIASQMSQTILPIAMPVDTDLACTQAGQNRECPGRRCPYFKTPEPVLFHKL